MLSIIISSYNSEYFSALENNIAETCGIPYQIIKIDNTGIMGICEAYNKGAEKAQFENLLFLHEDVEFLTKNWGEILLEEMTKIKDSGCFGVAGAKRKFQMPTGFISGIPGEGFRFIRQNIKEPPLTLQAKPITTHIIDGVFIGVKKIIWEQIRFDETISGFHFYDIAFSLETSVQYQNYLITNIDMVHFSKGNFGNDWIKSCLKFAKRKNYNFYKLNEKEKRIIRNYWYQRLSSEKISFLNRLKYCIAMGISKDSISLIKKFLKK